MEKIPKLILSAVIVVVIVIGLSVYGYLQSREYLEGPVVVIDEPANGSASAATRTTLRGSARNVSFLTLNGRQIFTDERGRFREPLLLHEGYNIATLEAKDRFGHVETKRLELVYKPEHDTNAANSLSE